MDRLAGYMIGTHYYRAPLPERGDWERDIANIKKIGMNTVKFFPQWRWHEREKGSFRWDDLDRLFEICAEQRLFVYINVILDAAPDWVFRDGHGIRVTNQGQVMEPVGAGCRYVGGWEPCFDDLRVRADAEGFLKAIVKRYRDHECLAVWDVWNEPRSRWGSAPAKSRANATGNG